MPDLIVAVLPNFDCCHDVLGAWERFGVPGITILESAGLHRIKQLRDRRDDMPLLPSLRHLTENEEYHHRTVFAVVGDDFDLDGLIAATEAAVGGSFDSPDTGVLFVTPVTRVFGLRSHATPVRR